jgi:hypothetical protein
MRLEEDKLEALRRWGQGLRNASTEEQAAAGRAILMLVEEVERLRLELLRTREQSHRKELASGEVDGDTDEPLASALRGRLSGASGRDSEGTKPGVGSEEAPTSPEAWLESLRRQD